MGNSKPLNEWAEVVGIFKHLNECGQEWTGYTAQNITASVLAAKAKGADFEEMVPKVNGGLTMMAALMMYELRSLDPKLAKEE